MQEDKTEDKSAASADTSKNATLWCAPRPRAPKLAASTTVPKYGIEVAARIAKVQLHQMDEATPKVATAAPTSQQRIIRIIDPKKLQQAGLDRRIAEALSRQKLTVKQRSTDSAAAGTTVKAVGTVPDAAESVPVIAGTSATTVERTVTASTSAIAKGTTAIATATSTTSKQNLKTVGSQLKTIERPLNIAGSTIEASKKASATFKTPIAASEAAVTVNETSTTASGCTTIAYGIYTTDLPPSKTDFGPSTTSTVSKPNIEKTPEATAEFLQNLSFAERMQHVKQMLKEKLLTKAPTSPTFAKLPTTTASAMTTDAVSRTKAATTKGTGTSKATHKVPKKTRTCAAASTSKQYLILKMPADETPKVATTLKRLLPKATPMKSPATVLDTKPLQLPLKRTPPKTPQEISRVLDFSSSGSSSSSSSGSSSGSSSSGSRTLPHIEVPTNMPTNCERLTQVTSTSTTSPAISAWLNTPPSSSSRSSILLKPLEKISQDVTKNSADIPKASIRSSVSRTLSPIKLPTTMPTKCESPTKVTSTSPTPSAIAAWLNTPPSSSSILLKPLEKVSQDVAKDVAKNVSKDVTKDVSTNTANIPKASIRCHYSAAKSTQASQFVDFSPLKSYYPNATLPPEAPLPKISTLKVPFAMQNQNSPLKTEQNVSSFQQYFVTMACPQQPQEEPAHQQHPQQDTDPQQHLQEQSEQQQHPQLQTKQSQEEIQQQQHPQSQQHRHQQQLRQQQLQQLFYEQQQQRLQRQHFQIPQLQQQSAQQHSAQQQSQQQQSAQQQSGKQQLQQQEQQPQQEQQLQQQKTEPQQLSDQPQQLPEQPQPPQQHSDPQPPIKSDVKPLHSKSLIVLEDKVLSQDEKIDLTVFGLGQPGEMKSTNATAQKATRPIHFPRPIEIKLEKTETTELPAIGATVSTDPQQSVVVVNAMQPKKFIVAADKLRMSKEKMAALARQIKSQAVQKTQLKQKIKQEAIETQPTEAIIKTESSSDNKHMSNIVAKPVQTAGENLAGTKIIVVDDKSMINTISLVKPEKDVSKKPQNILLVKKQPSSNNLQATKIKIEPKIETQVLDSNALSTPPIKTESLPSTSKLEAAKAHVEVVAAPLIKLEDVGTSRLPKIPIRKKAAAVCIYDNPPTDSTLSAVDFIASLALFSESPVLQPTLAELNEAAPMPKNCTVSKQLSTSAIQMPKRSVVRMSTGGVRRSSTANIASQSLDATAIMTQIMVEKQETIAIEEGPQIIATADKYQPLASLKKEPIIDGSFSKIIEKVACKDTLKEDRIKQSNKETVNSQEIEITSKISDTLNKVTEITKIIAPKDAEKPNDVSEIEAAQVDNSTGKILIHVNRKASNEAGIVDSENTTIIEEVETKNKDIKKDVDSAKTTSKVFMKKPSDSSITVDNAKSEKSSINEGDEEFPTISNSVGKKEYKTTIIKVLKIESTESTSNVRIEESKTNANEALTKDFTNNPNSLENIKASTLNIKDATENTILDEHSVNNAQNKNADEEIKNLTHVCVVDPVEAHSKDNEKDDPILITIDEKQDTVAVKQLTQKSVDNATDLEKTTQLLATDNTNNVQLSTTKRKVSNDETTEKSSNISTETLSNVAKRLPRLKKGKINLVQRKRTTETSADASKEKKIIINQAAVEVVTVVNESLVNAQINEDLENPSIEMPEVITKENEPPTTLTTEPVNKAAHQHVLKVLTYPKTTTPIKLKRLLKSSKNIDEDQQQANDETEAAKALVSLIQPPKDDEERILELPKIPFKRQSLETIKPVEVSTLGIKALVKQLENDIKPKEDSSEQTNKELLEKSLNSTDTTNLEKSKTSSIGNLSANTSKVVVDSLETEKTVKKIVLSKSQDDLEKTIDKATNKSNQSAEIDNTKVADDTTSTFQNMESQINVQDSGKTQKMENETKLSRRSKFRTVERELESLDNSSTITDTEKNIPSLLSAESTLIDVTKENENNNKEKRCSNSKNLDVELVNTVNISNISDSKKTETLELSQTNISTDTTEVTKYSNKKKILTRRSKSRTAERELKPTDSSTLTQHNLETTISKDIEIANSSTIFDTLAKDSVQINPESMCKTPQKKFYARRSKLESNPSADTQSDLDQSSTARESLDETAKEESSQDMLASKTTCRKRLRKTMDDIKRWGGHNPLDTETDSDDERDVIDADEGVTEFLGFDETSPNASKLQKNLQILIAATSAEEEEDESCNERLPNNEIERRDTTINKSATGMLEEWLTTGKAAAPTTAKHEALVKQNMQKKVATTKKTMPLKKRWELAQKTVPDETDITDDTSPADDDDDDVLDNRQDTNINSSFKELANKNSNKRTYSNMSDEKKETTKQLKADSVDILQKEPVDVVNKEHVFVEPQPLKLNDSSSVTEIIYNPFQHTENLSPLKVVTQTIESPKQVDDVIVEPVVDQTVKHVSDSDSETTNETSLTKKRGRKPKKFFDDITSTSTPTPSTATVEIFNPVKIDTQSTEIPKQIDDAIVEALVKNVTDSENETTEETSLTKKRERKPKKFFDDITPTSTSTPSTVNVENLSPVKVDTQSTEIKKQVDDVLLKPVVPYAVKNVTDSENETTEETTLTKKRGRKQKKFFNDLTSTSTPTPSTANTESLSPVKTDTQSTEIPKQVDDVLLKPVVAPAVKNITDSENETTEETTLAKKRGRKPKILFDDITSTSNANAETLSPVKVDTQSIEIPKEVDDVIVEAVGVLAAKNVSDSDRETTKETPLTKKRGRKPKTSITDITLQSTLNTESLISPLKVDAQEKPNQVEDVLLEPVDVVAAKKFTDSENETTIETPLPRKRGRKPKNFFEDITLTSTPNKAAPLKPIPEKTLTPEQRKTRKRSSRLHEVTDEELDMNSPVLAESESKAQSDLSMTKESTPTTTTTTTPIVIKKRGRKANIEKSVIDNNSLEGRSRRKSPKSIIEFFTTNIKSKPTKSSETETKATSSTTKTVEHAPEIFIKELSTDEKKSKVKLSVEHKKTGLKRKRVISSSNTDKEDDISHTTEVSLKDCNEKNQIATAEQMQKDVCEIERSKPKISFADTSDKISENTDDIKSNKAVEKDFSKTSTLSVDKVATSVEPKKRGRKRKILSEDLPDKLIQIESSKPVDEEIEKEAGPKKRGRKRRILSDDSLILESAHPVDEEVEIEKECDVSTTAGPKKRGRKPKIKLEGTACSELNSTAGKANLSDAVDSTTNETPVVGPKKRGRKPKNLMLIASQLDDTTEKSIKREVIHEPYNPRLLLITKREQLDTDEALTVSKPEGAATAGLLQCGLCMAKTTKGKWISHLSEHYGIGWEHGKQPAMDISLRSVVLTAIINFYKSTKVKGLTCRLCGRLYRSGLGLLLHLDTCGISAEELKKTRLNCPYCENSYAKLTLPVHVRTCPVRLATINEEAAAAAALNESTADLNSSAEVLNNVGRVKRVSVMKAETSLKKIEEDSLSAAAAEFDAYRFIKYHPPITEDFPTKFAEDLQSFDKGFCVQKSCRFTATDLVTMQLHMESCKFIPKPGYHCTACFKSVAKVYATREAALEHVESTHRPRDEDFEGDSSDCNLDGESESSDDEGSSGVNSNEEEDGEVGGDGASVRSMDTSKRTKKLMKKLKIRNNHNSFIVRQCLDRKTLFPVRSAAVKLESYVKWKHFLTGNYTTDMLYDYARVSYSLHGLTDDVNLEHLLPRERESMKLNYAADRKCPSCTFGATAVATEWRQFQRFETLTMKDEHCAFIGAPIKSLAWAPQPKDCDSASQFLAVSYRQDLDKFTRYLNPKIYSTLILIYKVTTKTCDDKIQLHYALQISDAPVHCLEFLPSGGYAPSANRLGLLAVGTAAGISAYALPLEIEANKEEEISKKVEEMKEEFKTTSQKCQVLNLAPAFVLILDINDVGATSDSEHWGGSRQCMRLKWSEFQEHNYLFAGFANGFVGIWDISEQATDNLNRFVINEVRHFVPLTYFFCGEKGVRDMALHYDTAGPRWLAVCSFARRVVIYDLRDLSQPSVLRDDVAKNITAALEWPVMWENFAVSMGDAIPNNGECLYIRSPLQMHYTHSKIDNMLTGVNLVKYNPWHHAFASATENGDLLLHGMRELHYDVNSRDARGIMKNRMWAGMDIKCLGDDVVKQSCTEINAKVGDDAAAATAAASGVEKHTMEMFEQDYKQKYGVVFAPLIKVGGTEVVIYSSKRRVPPKNLIRYTRINSLSCNLNSQTRNLIAYGYENGFLRIINTNRNDYFDV